MRVLFVPMAPAPIDFATFVGHRYTTPIAHIVTLLALRSALGKSADAAFLVPFPAHHRTRGIEVVDVNHLGQLDTELEAYVLFKPDVVVDDGSVTTGAATAIVGVPRVTLVRSGSFKGYVPRDPRQHHTLELGGLPTMETHGVPRPTSVTDLFRASLHIVPGIRTIERLPDSERNNPSYIYCGPLLLSESDATLDGFAPPGLSRDDVRTFCARHKRGHRPIILVTAGTNWKPSILHACIRRLLKRGYAVISTCIVDGLPSSITGEYCASYFVSMQEACRHVDVVVHHCGSGTYHYPLIQGVPSVTVGSGCYDRDDIGVRLEEIGVAVHIVHRDDSAAQVTEMVDAVSFSIGRKQSLDFRRRIVSLQREIAATQADFNCEQVLRRALQRV